MLQSLNNNIHGHYFQNVNPYKILIHKQHHNKNNKIPKCLAFKKLKNAQKVYHNNIPHWTLPLDAMPEPTDDAQYSDNDDLDIIMNNNINNKNVSTNTQKQNKYVYKYQPPITTTENNNDDYFIDLKTFTNDKKHNKNTKNEFAIDIDTFINNDNHKWKPENEFEIDNNALIDKNNEFSVNLDNLINDDNNDEWVFDGFTSKPIINNEFKPIPIIADDVSEISDNELFYQHQPNPKPFIQPTDPISEVPNSLIRRSERIKNKSIVKPRHEKLIIAEPVIVRGTELKDNEINN